MDATSTIIEQLKLFLSFLQYNVDPGMPENAMGARGQTLFEWHFWMTGAKYNIQWILRKFKE